MRFGESLYLRDLVDWGKAKIDIAWRLSARETKELLSHCQTPRWVRDGKCMR